MVTESGNIQVQTENIFPIIKQWLYSDKDIFLRELVSNGCDAVQKLKRLSDIGQVDTEGQLSLKVNVELDKDNGIIRVMDNGIGMTADEVKKYINQVAFSSAQEFLEKYKGQPGEENQIIGHFGLGFYSVFMVAEKVEIDTLSWQEGAEPVRWISETGMEYQMEASDSRTQRGTTITLHIGEDSKEFLEGYRLREILNKYCSFLPVEIYFEDLKDRKESKDKDGLVDPKPINDTRPLWLKHPNECTDEEYKEFYQKVFNDFREPLFWIHLNVDYPFNLKGILYFPRLNNRFDTLEGQIKLYSSQVFVADNIKEVIPEFLLLLKGTIDCPDLPLNVSRSFLQNDGYVQKISTHITKKIGDKLSSLFKNERENYEKYWEDINPFIKYGCLRDQKFYDRVKDFIIFETLEDKYVTLDEYLEKGNVASGEIAEGAADPETEDRPEGGDETEADAKPEGEKKEAGKDGDDEEKQVFYVNDKTQQSQYIRLFKENGLNAIYLDSIIDNHFISFLEMNVPKVKFRRVDADISDSLKETDDDKKDKAIKKESKDLEKLFKKVLDKGELKIKVEGLKNRDVPAMVLLSEESRRMEEMAARFGDMGMNYPFPKEETLVINRNSDLVQSVLGLSQDKSREEDMKMICQHIYDLALIAHKPLEGDEMLKFIERSNKVLAKLVAL
ncbi:MAG: molecular chaperone HtpG [Clostridiales bacterium]|nr:molecular chaperone HtpG [Clostridiales bacterium]